MRSSKVSNQSRQMGCSLYRSFSEHRSPIVVLARLVVAIMTLILSHPLPRTRSCTCGPCTTAICCRLTYLMPAPLCTALDPADRAIYLGHDDGSISMVEFQASSTSQRSDIATSSLSKSNMWNLPGHDGETGSVNALGVSYDGTTVTFLS